jgi:hypothetical protein
MTNKTSIGIPPFFSLSYWMRLLFMLLLAAAFIGTSGPAVWRLMQSSSRLPITIGTIVEIAETRTSNRSAIYRLVLRDDQGELKFVQLRNNGRILNYLLAQDQAELATRRVAVEHTQDFADKLSFQNGTASILRESGLQPVVQLLIGFIPLLIILLHVQPHLVEQRLS